MMESYDFLMVLMTGSLSRQCATEKRATFTNGTFIVMIDDATEDHFGKSCNGVNVSLESYNITDTLNAIPSAADKDGVARVWLHS